MPTLTLSRRLSSVTKGSGRCLNQFVVPSVFDVCRLLRAARWRKQPASDAQKEFIKKRWKVVGDLVSPEVVGDSKNSDSASQIAKMTKGEAGNIITRLKHGAQVRR